MIQKFRTPRRAFGFVVLVAAAVAALAAVAAFGTGKAAAASGTGVATLTSHGTVNASFTGSSIVTDGTSTEVSGLDVDEDVPNSGNSAARVPSSGVPTPAANGADTATPGLTQRLAGLNHADERNAGTGKYANTNFSLEPPDQALCVGGGTVLEGVNTALRGRSASTGAPGAVININQLFGLSPAINRSVVPAFRGAFTSDPKCIYDNGHFIVTILEAGQKQDGHFDGTGGVYIAVSATNDPYGAWSIYSFDNANDGGDCPCLGDQPLIGADANGVYITTNSFPFFHNGFNGAQVYAISKSQLESGAATIDVVHVPVTSPAGFEGGLPYTLQPAKTVPGSNNAANTEYFLSAADFNATLDNRIAVWALTGTNTLGGTNHVTLTGKTVGSEVYGQPPAAQQSDAGVFPLRDGLFGLSVQQALYGVQFDGGTYHTELLNSNDDRMNEVVYAGGKLYGAVNTVVKTANGPTLNGIAWFVVNPNGTMANQGYLSVNQENLMFPAFGVNSAGKGAIGVTIVGTDMHPSTAYAIYNGSSFGPLHIAFSGPVPDDGFTGYEALLPNVDVARKPGTQKGVARWGDYGATAVDTDGSIWLANETTSNSRTLLANWGTEIEHITP
jgi:hypothetical protein